LPVAHDTPDRVLAMAPGGFGVAWTRQLLPSQRIASVRGTAASFSKSPTAMQLAVPEHEMAAR
jgi:hypothetical protein